MSDIVISEEVKREVQRLKKALQQAHLLLQTVSIRTAPQSPKELAQSSNMTTRNAAYLHPDVLRRFGMDVTPGVREEIVLGSLCLIVCTPLLPPFGVIYGPLYDLFLSAEQRAEEFEQHWNVARLHRPGQAENLLPQRTQRNAEELQGEFVQKLGLNEYPYDRVFAFKHLPYAMCEPFFK